jgi:hypothetical protein
MTGYVHSWAYIEPTSAIDPWKAFAAASSAPYASPEWTLGDDPKNDPPAPDAAGTLWRAHEHVGEEVPPTIQAAARMFGEGVEALGAYFSSGGAGIFLLRDPLTDQFIVVIARGDEPEPRFGHREEFLVEYLYGSRAVRRAKQAIEGRFASFVLANGPLPIEVEEAS